MKFTDTSLFNFLPSNFEVDILSSDEDEVYTFAHNVVITATQFAEQNTTLDFEDFDEEREDAILFVIDKIKNKNIMKNLLEKLTGYRVCYIFRCDDKKRGNIPTDKHFLMTEVKELNELLEKCNKLRLNYDLVVQEWIEEEQSIDKEIYIIGNNYKNN